MSEAQAATLDDREQASAIAGGMMSRTSPRPMAHVQGVAREAEALFGDRPLTSAAWLHEIWQAPAIAVPGFHPVDGARRLRIQGRMKRSFR